MTAATEIPLRDPLRGGQLSHGASLVKDHHWTAEWHRRLDEVIAELPTHAPHVQATIRRKLGEDPVAFAVLYFGHHLRDQAGVMSFSQIHYTWATLGLKWAETQSPEPQEQRDAVVGPRESGKSTWWFLILPMWAMAYKHRTFVAAFADTSTQAESHLLTIRMEMDANALLQHDFPELTTPSKRRSGGTVSDRGGMIHLSNGCVFAARGMDSGMLGMKIGSKRPDLLIFDDIEPDEKVYSADIAAKRLGTLTDAAMPLNIRASVVMVGTVTMPGSIMHQCVKAAKGVEVADWIADENVKCHYYPAILTDDEGREVSIWPQKWPLSWLQSQRHTRSYAKNYDNDPMARDGVYWRREDFRYGDLEGCTKTALFIDPAVTSKKTSDLTGLAVVSYKPAVVQPVPFRQTSSGIVYKRKVLEPSKVVVRYSRGVRLTGQHLKDYVVNKVLPAFPKVRLIFVESNQGGDLWQDVFGDIPGIVVVQHNSTSSKEIRFGEALEYWQRGRVHHSQRWDQLEEQAVGFPNASHDDVVDAAVSGVRYFLMPDDRPQVGFREGSYT